MRIFHSPDWQSVRAVAAARAASLHQPSRDVLVHYSLESPLMMPADLDPAYMGHFELRVGYHRALSTIAQPYVATSTESWTRRLLHPNHRVEWRAKVRHRLLVTAVSNCVSFSGRRHYLAALRDALGDEFINLGSCVPSGGRSGAASGGSRAVNSVAPNKYAPGHAPASVADFDRSQYDRKSDPSGSKTDALIAGSYFYLALENANCADYITEKLGRAVVAGVVPVVFDPRADYAQPAANDAPPRVPGYASVLPPGSYINVADFASAADLGAYLRRVAANQSAYTAYLWPRRVSPRVLRARWPALANLPNASATAEKPECRLARAALGVRREAAARRLTTPRLVPDSSCLPPRQLCRHLGRAEDVGGCRPGGDRDRVRPAVVAAPTRGGRYTND